MGEAEKNLYFRKLKAAVNYLGPVNDLRVLVEKACGMAVPLNRHDRKLLQSLLKLKHPIPVIQANRI